MTDEHSPERRRGVVTRRRLGAAGCAAGLPLPAAAQRHGGAAQATLAEGVTQLGDRLLRDLALGPRPPGYLLSPYNLHATLGLLGLGARGANTATFARALGMPGNTADVMAAAMRATRVAVEALNQAGTRTTLAYSGWTRQGSSFQQEWRDRARIAAVPRLAALDFGGAAAVPTINGWVRDATRGEIPSVVERLGRDTELVLAGAIHFAGNWAVPFPRDRTAPAPFFKLDGSSASADMMSVDARLLYGQRELGHVVRLGYAGERLAMWVATARRPEDSAAFLEAVAAAGPGNWVRETVLRPRLTNMRLPKLSFAAGGEMLPALRNAGFGPALSGDFTGILGRPVRPSQVAHQASIRIDEEGTVAAAATAVVGTRSASEMAIFSADRPFVFVLGVVDPWLPLFMGYVGDASAIRV